MRVSRFGAITVAGLCVVCAAGCSRNPADDSGAGSAALEAAPGASAGWLATYSSSAGQTTRTLSPTAAFAIEAGESVHPAVESDGLRASFDGLVSIGERGRYRFGAAVEGGEAAVSVRTAGGEEHRAPLLGGKPTSWGEWLDLREGLVRVRYEFARNGPARARLRPLWEMQRAGLNGFVDEPIPSRVVAVAAAASEEEAGAASVLRGRVLLGELGCVACHAGPTPAAILRQAPDLTEVARRADGDWMRRWISGPQAMKPGSGMPDLIGDSEAGALDAGAIVAFLQSLAEPGEWASPATEESVIGEGRALYRSIGCVACHGEANSEQNAGWSPRFPFGDMVEKWNPGALAAYLHEPNRARPSGHMPSFLLTEGEADLLADYLAAEWGAGDGGRTDATDEQIAFGRKRFSANGCVNCHRLDGIEAVLSPKPVGELELGAGCLDPGDPSTPRYALRGTQADDLRAALRELSGWSEPTASPIDHAQLAMHSLNCVACHDWHGRGGVPGPIRDSFETLADVDLGDEGRIPPRLAGVGWKLTSVWLGQVIGEGARARPYMKARMPVFASEHAGALVDELARLDGVWPGADAREPEVNDELVQAGLKLVGTSGLNCISCHTFADRPPSGLPGPSVSRFGERLRYDWWRRYVFAPLRFKPGTRMPSFFITGHSPLTSILAGNAKRQTDAMWAYFSLGDLFMPTPEGILAPGGMVVLVREEPVVLRTFLDGVGARGIAVGFPAGVHFAFDANTSRLVYAWTGSFLDASGAWAGRGGNVVGGQGPTVWTAAPGPVIAIGERPEAWDGIPPADFAGYRLDGDGVPTFLSTLAGAAVEETVRPYPRAGVLFERSVEVSGIDQGQAIWLRPGPNGQLAAVAGGSAEESGGLVRVDVQSDPVTITLEVPQ